MGEREQIDIAYDFRRDTPPGKDPDTHSPTLRRYHKLLWSKPLPNGVMLDLDDTTRGHYLLHHSDELGEFSLSSDAVVASFRYVPMVQDEPEQLKEFMHIGYTMGGMMLWPGNQIDGRMGINQTRGFHPRIRDQFDLTVECIRRHYLGEQSPMKDCLARYADFFDLFRDFRGFVEYFLLQDAVTVDCEAVIFSAPFDNFTTARIPKTMDEYREYRQRAITFIEARNRRILRWCSEDHAPCPREGTKSVRNRMTPAAPPAGTQLTAEAVLHLAEEYGTREELERAMKVAAEKRLRVRPFKTCLMFTPPSNATRCLFTIWAKPEQGGLKAWVGIEPFTEFFALEPAKVEQRLGPEGWRTLDQVEFGELLRIIEALLASDESPTSLPARLRGFVDQSVWTFAKTILEWPHEYIAKDRVDEGLFQELVSHIRTHGHEGSFYERVLIYYEEAGMVYWTMGAPIAETTIVNRCRSEDTYERRLEAGTLP